MTKKAEQPKHPWVDRPISSGAEDLLGRLPLAMAVAQQIRDLPHGESFVVALSGPWGCGKSSLLAMVSEEFDRTGEVVVVSFNPWLFSGADDLVRRFFEEIGAQLSAKKKIGAPLAKAAELLPRMGAALTTLGVAMTMSPEILQQVAQNPITALALIHLAQSGGAAIGELGKGATTVSDHLTKMFGGRAAPSLLEQRREIEVLLRKSKRRVLVLVDDLDRLEGKEVRDILKLVRLTADFPNVIYLVAFDRPRVEAVLGADDYGRQYLEKVFQVIYDVPTPRAEQLVAILASEIDRVLASLQVPESDGAWIREVFAVVAPFMATPRDIKRYVMSVAGTLPHLHEEVHPGDVLGMEAIRVFCPAAFAQLATYAEPLTVGRQLGFPGVRTEKLPDLDAFFSLAGARGQDLRLLALNLFPRSVQNTIYGAEWDAGWRRHRRVATRSVLAYYLERTLPTNVVPRREIREILADLSTPDRCEARLRKLAPKHLGNVFDQLTVYADEILPEQMVSSLVVTGNCAAHLPEATPFEFNEPIIRFGRFTHWLLRRLEGSADRLRVVLEAMPRIRFLGWRHRLLRTIGNARNVGTHLLDPEDEAAGHAALRKDILASTAETLAADTLLFWEVFAPYRDDSEVMEHLWAVSKNPAVALRLVESAIGSRSAFGLGSVNVHTTWTLPWTQLHGVLGADAEQVLRQMAASTQRAGLSETQLRALDVLDRYLSGWRPEEDD